MDDESIKSPTHVNENDEPDSKRYKQVMPVVYGRFQAVAIGRNAMPAVFLLQRIIL